MEAIDSTEKFKEPGIAQIARDDMGRDCPYHVWFIIITVTNQTIANSW
jgi:hypothetical protein